MDCIDCICLQGSEGNFHMKRCEGWFHPPIHSDSLALVPKLAEDHQVSPTKTSRHLPWDGGWQNKKSFGEWNLMWLVRCVSSWLSDRPERVKAGSQSDSLKVNESTSIKTAPKKKETKTQVVQRFQSYSHCPSIFQCFFFRPPMFYFYKNNTRPFSKWLIHELSQSFGIVVDHLSRQRIQNPMATVFPIFT